MLTKSASPMSWLQRRNCLAVTTCPQADSLKIGGLMREALYTIEAALMHVPSATETSVLLPVLAE